MRWRGTAGWAAVASVMALMAAAPAGAATIDARENCTGAHGNCDWIVSFQAAAGEANDITTETGGSTLRLRDAGAPLQAGSGCHQVDAHEAQCPGGLGYVEIDTGDRDDRVAGPVPGDVLLGPGNDSYSGEGGGVSGGPGDDVLSGTQRGSLWFGDEGNDRLSATGFHVQLDGGVGDDELMSGDGADDLNGGPGSDVVHAGAGDDYLTGDDLPELDAVAAKEVPAGDELDGGPGLDIVSYGRRTRFPVTVDLADPGPDGSAGEGDRLTSIEGAAGGYRSDVLTGDDGPNHLEGGPGDDLLTGAGGDDFLAGDQGFDRFVAGDGDDAIVSSTSYRSPDPEREPVDCGAGDDLLEAVQGDVAAPDCEATTIFADSPPHFALVPVSADARTATFAVPCPRPVRVRKRCSGTLALRAHRRLYGKRRFDVAKGGGRVTLRRPTGTRAHLFLRYRKGADRYGIDVYLDLPPA